MSDDFLNDEFFLKLIRLGVEDPKLRHASRTILQRLHDIREEKEGNQKTSRKRNK